MQSSDCIIYTVYTIMQSSDCIIYTIYTIIQSSDCIIYTVYTIMQSSDCIIYTIYTIIHSSDCIIYTIYTIKQSDDCIIYVVQLPLTTYILWPEDGLTNRLKRAVNLKISTKSSCVLAYLFSYIDLYIHTQNGNGTSKAVILFPAVRIS